MAELQQWIGSLPDDWRMRVALGLVGLVCYGLVVCGIGSFTAFGSRDDV